MTQRWKERREAEEEGEIRGAGGLWSWHGWRLLSAGISRGQWSVFLSSRFPVRSQKAAAFARHSPEQRWHWSPENWRSPNPPAMKRLQILLHTPESCGFCLMIRDRNRIGMLGGYFFPPESLVEKERILEVSLLKRVSLCFLSFSSLVLLLGDRGAWQETDSSSRIITRAETAGERVRHVVSPDIQFGMLYQS